MYGVVQSRCTQVEDLRIFRYFVRNLKSSSRRGRFPSGENIHDDGTGPMTTTAVTGRSSSP